MKFDKSVKLIGIISILFLFTGMATAVDVVDDFEDGDTVGWDTSIGADSFATFNAQTSTVANGSYSLFAEHNSGSNAGAERTFSNSTQNTIDASLRLGTTTTAKEGEFRFKDYKDNIIIQISLSDGGKDDSLTVNGNTMVSGISQSKWYNVKLENIDYGNNEVGNVIVNGVDKGSVNFQNNADNISKQVFYILSDGFEDADIYADGVTISNTAKDNVTFNNFQPPDNSNYSLGDTETITADVSVESDNYSTVDVEGIFDGQIETVSNISTDNSTNTVSFTKTFSNTGTKDYYFQVISDSPNGNPIDQTNVRTVNISTDKPTFDLQQPNQNEQFYRLNLPENILTEYNFTAGNDESWSIDQELEDPQGNVIDADSFNSISSGNEVSIQNDVSIDEFGTWNYRIEATGDTSGDVVTSSNRDFTVSKENASITLRDPSSTTDSLETFNRDDFDQSSDSDNWIADGSLDAEWENGVLVTDSTPRFSQGTTYDNKAKTVSSSNLNLTGDVGSLQELDNFNAVGIFRYNNSIELQDDKHWFNASVSKADNSIGMTWDGSVYLRSETTGRVNVKFSYDSNDNEYDILYDNGTTLHQVSSNFDKGDRIDWGIGLGHSALVSGTETDIDWVDSDAQEVTATGVNQEAYIETLPYDVGVKANTENDQVVNIEFQSNNTVFDTVGVTGDGTLQNFTKSQNYVESVFGIPAGVNVLGSDGTTEIATKSVSVSVVQKPEFNLVNPSNDTIIQVDNVSKQQEFTEFEGEVTVGEAGTGTIRLKEPNGSFKDVLTRSFTRSDVGDTFTIKGETLVQNINLTLDKDKLKNLSEYYEWSMAYDGTDSNTTFNYNTSRWFRYGDEVESNIDKIVDFFQGINKELKSALGSSGQFFVATLIVLLSAGIAEYYFQNEVISITTLVMMALAFTFADGYYPLGAFWIMAGIVGIAGAYFGGKVFGGG